MCVCVSIESSLTGLGVGERRSWDVCFTQEFNDWEMDEGVNFIRILGANIPSMDVGDRMRWKLKSNGDFDIHSFYNKLQGNPSIGFPWKVIGRVMGPRRISFFVWSIAWNKILTSDNLRWRVLILWVGVLCVVSVGRRWIIYYFIVRWLIGCGVLFLFLLEFCGSYLERFQICFLASGIGWGSIHLISRVPFVLTLVSLEGAELAYL